MRINTKRLTLVPLGPEFLLSAHEYSGDLENTRLMVFLPDADINETAEFLENSMAEWQKSKPMFYEFAILKDSEHIGAVSVYLSDDYTEGELGWIINKKYWGNGYATEAARAVFDFAVRELKVRRIFAHCDSENVASYKVMEKLGMTLVSRTRGRKNRSSDEDREELEYALELRV